MYIETPSSLQSPKRYLGLTIRLSISILTFFIGYCIEIGFISPKPLAHGELLWSLDVRRLSATITSNGTLS